MSPSAAIPDVPFPHKNNLDFFPFLQEKTGQLFIGGIPGNAIELHQANLYLLMARDAPLLSFAKTVDDVVRQPLCNTQ